jgi:transcription termination factor Rho
VWTLRRMIDALGGGADAVEPVLDRLRKTRSNAEFLSTLNRNV